MPTANPLSRVRAALERFDLRDRATQVAIASIGLIVILLATILLWPSGGDDPPAEGALAERGPGAVTELAEEALENPDIAVGGGRDSSPSGGSGAAPDAGEVPAAEPGAPPITDTEIKVGIAYNEDPGAANEAAGFGGIGQVDQRRGWEAMLAEVNKNPPLGRKLVPVWYSFTTDDVTSKGAERLSQEMCAHWTQDNKVFMVWGGGDDTRHACLTKAGVPEVGGGAGLSWRKTYEDFPYLVSPTSAALDRMAEFQVDRLVEQDFFTEFKDNAPPYTPQAPIDGEAKIALIRYDEPSYKAAAQTLKARLATHGLELCDGCEFEISYSSDNVQEQLDDATEVNAAIQNCKSRPGGPCTHMLFLGSTAGVRITLFFVDGAEKQAYRPRLGLNPLDAPKAVKDFLGEASYPQWRDSIYVTWTPRDLGNPPEAFERCKVVFEDAGETFGGDDSSGNKENQISGYCDNAWYTAEVLGRAGTSLSVDSFMNGVASVDPVPSAGTYLMQTRADRHDGVGAIRIGEWSDECECFEPTSDIIPV